MKNSVLVCHRVVDMPSPPVVSSKLPCDRCAAEIWVAQSSPTVEQRLCIPCAGIMINKALGLGEEITVSSLTDAQITDIERLWRR